MARTRTDELLLGEWACLGILARAPAHGYDVAAQLVPEGPVGRVWTVSRPLTYRALDQLVLRGLVTPVGHEKGKAGGERTILAPTRSGRSQLRRWLREPVPHVRDVRSELLLKLVLCQSAGVDPRPLLEAQRDAMVPIVRGLSSPRRSARPPVDPVALWRAESSRAALRFLDRMLAAAGATDP